MGTTKAECRTSVDTGHVHTVTHPFYRPLANPPREERDAKVTTDDFLCGTGLESRAATGKGKSCFLLNIIHQERKHLYFLRRYTRPVSQTVEAGEKLRLNPSVHSLGKEKRKMGQCCQRSHPQECKQHFQSPRLKSRAYSST